MEERPAVRVEVWLPLGLLGPASALAGCLVFNALESAVDFQAALAALVGLDFLRTMFHLMLLSVDCKKEWPNRVIPD